MFGNKDGGMFGGLFDLDRDGELSVGEYDWEGRMPDGSDAVTA